MVILEFKANCDLEEYSLIEYWIIAMQEIWLQSGTPKNYCVLEMTKNAVLLEWPRYVQMKPISKKKKFAI